MQLTKAIETRKTKCRVNCLVSREQLNNDCVPLVI